MYPTQGREVRCIYTGEGVTMYLHMGGSMCQHRGGRYIRCIYIGGGGGSIYINTGEGVRCIYTGEGEVRCNNTREVRTMHHTQGSYVRCIHTGEGGTMY